MQIKSRKPEDIAKDCRTGHTAQIPASQNAIHALQTKLGNQSVRRLLDSVHIQAKLSIGQPNDLYEQEADRVADQVMKMSGQKVREVSPKPIVGKIKPQLQVQTDGVSSSINTGIKSLQGRGWPLTDSERCFYEQRFDIDFYSVRVHNDSESDKLNRLLNAEAFTFGKDIFFRQGFYPPVTLHDQKLLSHELTHVVQQSNTQKFQSRFPIIQCQILHREPNWGNAPTEQNRSFVVFDPFGFQEVGGIQIANSFQGNSENMDLHILPGFNEGYVGLQLFVRWLQDNVEVAPQNTPRITIGDYSGEGEAIIRVPFSINDQGVLVLDHAAHTVNTGTRGLGAVFELPENPSLSGNTLRVGARVNGVGTESQWFAASGQRIIGAEHATVQEVPAGYGWAHTFVIRFIPPFSFMLEATSPTATRLIVYFPVRLHTLAERQRREIVNWFLQFPDSVKRGITNGSLRLSIDGYASTTSDPDFNMGLSRRRAETIRDILAGASGSHQNVLEGWRLTPHGEDDEERNDERENAEQRRVIVEIPLSPAHPLAQTETMIF